MLLVFLVFFLPVLLLIRNILDVKLSCSGRHCSRRCPSLCFYLPRVTGKLLWHPVYKILSSNQAVITLTAETPPTSHRARVVGGANLIKACSGIIGPFFCGMFVGKDPTLPVLSFASIMFLASICALLLPKEMRGVELVDVVGVVGVEDDEGVVRRESGGGSGEEFSMMSSLSTTPLLSS